MQNFFVNAICYLQQPWFLPHEPGLYGKVIVPKENEKDLEEVPEHIKSELQFIVLDSIDQASEVALKVPEEAKRWI